MSVLSLNNPQSAFRVDQPWFTKQGLNKGLNHEFSLFLVISQHFLCSYCSIMALCDATSFLLQVLVRRELETMLFDLSFDDCISLLLTSHYSQAISLSGNDPLATAPFRRSQTCLRRRLACFSNVLAFSDITSGSFYALAGVSVTFTVIGRGFLEVIKACSVTR